MTYVLEGRAMGVYEQFGQTSGIFSANHDERQTMKNRIFIFAALCMATAVMVGCKKSNPMEETPPPVDTNTIASSVTQQLQNAKDMATNAWLKTKETTTNAWENMKQSVQSAVDYTFDKKDAFAAKASADLDALDQNIKDLGDKAATGTDSVKADAQVKLQELRDKRTALQQKMDEVKNATAANWDEAKAGFQQSYDDMKAATKSAWEWLKDKLGT
jgi:phosphopentomutase